MLGDKTKKYLNLSKPVKDATTFAASTRTKLFYHPMLHPNASFQKEGCHLTSEQSNPQGIVMFIFPMFVRQFLVLDVDEFWISYKVKNYSRRSGIVIWRSHIGSEQLAQCCLQ